MRRSTTKLPRKGHALTDCYLSYHSDRLVLGQEVQTMHCIVGWLSLLVVEKHQDCPGTSLQFEFDAQKMAVVSEIMVSNIHQVNNLLNSRSIPPRNGVRTTPEKATHHIGDRLSDLSLMCLCMLHVKQADVCRVPQTKRCHSAYVNFTPY